ncbi:PAS domain S-box protein [Pedobacter sp. N36a]|uniref:sensor histidine kinase n=1 Tax=Pedobacter sp. N36a TaxID=2767996 RepID=UPI00165717F7|nr:PAS domain S-box protein [Pedobacter sp. N36a]MBC8988040.1 PAS domain S-box protein [Pedobacter sp. N36a]
MSTINYPHFSLDFHKNILESLEDYGVFTTDKQGIVTSWNKGAENVLGYVEQEICGQSAKIIFTDEDRKNEIPEHEFTEAMEKGRGQDERYHQRKDGSLFWASGLVFPLYDNDQKHIGFTKILRNLSNRKQAEEEVLEARKYAQSIVETSKEPILILNADLSINSASKSFFKLFNLDKHEVENLNLFEVLSRSLDPQALKEQMQSYDSFENLELIHPQKETDEEHILLVSSRKVFQTFKSIGQFLLTFEDVTFGRKLEQAKEDFMNIASHELKTPISVIRSYTQLLGLELKGKSNDRVNKILKRILHQSDQLNKLTSLLLDVSAFNAGNINLNKEPFVLLELVLEIAAEIAETANHQIILQEISDVRVMADRARIAQAITNLITNAIKYSPDADTIHLNLQVDEGKKSVRLSVQDYGIGISLHNQQDLFKRFSRSNHTKARNIDGFGMGLYLSQEIIKAHQSQISIISDGENGSIFYFDLDVI